ncbi:MAG TPA: hydrogenase, partial [Anaerolineae bacterium]
MAIEREEIQERRAAGADNRFAVIEPGHTYASVTEKISSIVLTEGLRRGWVVGFGLSFLLLSVFTYAVIYLLLVGTGIWGI